MLTNVVRKFIGGEGGTEETKLMGGDMRCNGIAVADLEVEKEGIQNKTRAKFLRPHPQMQETTPHCGASSLARGQTPL